MSELSYNDHCVITRSTGDPDEWDKLVCEKVYDGVCDFQPEDRRVFRSSRTMMWCISHGR